MLEVALRELEPQEDVPAELAALAPFDAWLFDDPAARRLIAVDGGVVVGAGATLRTVMHPLRAFASVVVTPAHRRVGVGRALLAELRNTSVPLKARLPEGADGFAFATVHGFSRFVTSHTAVIGRDAITSLPEPAIVVRPPLDDEVVSAVRAQYALTHRWDPPAPWTLDETRTWLCSDAIAAAVVADGDEIRAVGLLHDDGEVAVCGGTEEPTPALVAPVLAALIRAAGGPLTVEVDEGADNALWEVVTSVPHQLVPPAVVVLGD